MRPIIYFFILFAFSTEAVAQDQLVEILADSLFSAEVNDQSSDSTGASLVISADVYGAQSFIVDKTGILTRIELNVRKPSFLVQDARLSLEIKTGSDPGLGSSLITKLFLVSNNIFTTIYSIVLTDTIAVTKGDALVMIVKKTSGGDALWERSLSDVYDGGNAFVNASGWIPLSNQDHWFRSYIEVPDSAIVSYFSVADDGLINVNNRITNVTDPISAQDAATKAYVDLLEATIIALEAKVDLLETTIPKYVVGDFAQGGIVFWVDETGQHGLVCAKSDRSSGIRWYAGTHGVTRATGDGVYAGAANTVIAISSQVASGDDGSSYAAQICNDLKITEGGTTYGDWYLPSKHELNLMYQNKVIINGTALANGGSGFSSDHYWSSTEEDYSRALEQGFNDGNQWFNGKASNLDVRAVRAF